MSGASPVRLPAASPDAEGTAIRGAVMSLTSAPAGGWMAAATCAGWTARPAASGRGPAGGGRDEGAVGDDEAVARGGGELGDHADHVEPDRTVCAVGAGEPQLDRVAGPQLVVVQGFLGD